MDILTHTISGMAAASVVANISNQKWIGKIKMIITGAVAGALPDIDVITRWKGFDGTFGQWFNLTISGDEAFGAKLWYSHHAFFHSLLASVMFGVLLGLIMYFVRSKFKLSKLSLIKVTPFVVAFILGFNMHLLEDMVTPGGGWGGIAYLWPSKVYVGGFGNTWWWNNYDIFLLANVVVIINVLLFFIGKKRFVKIAGVLVFVVGFSLGLMQIKSRNYNFNSRENINKEALSKEIQQDVLGDKVFYMMEKLDVLIPVAF